MKVLFIQNGMHIKNLNALRKYDIFIISINHTNLDTINLHHFDIIYSPSLPIDVSKYPNSKFIFGPHFSVFPNKNQIDLISGNKNVIYIQPSEWAKNAWVNNLICNELRFEILPFGVDTDNFNQIKSITERNKVFIYFKRRQPDELNFVIQFLNSRGITAKLFDYVNRYHEHEYIDYLHDSKFGIWLDAHESQGFALEEALSCNVPLLVWDVVSMNQEYRSNYENIPATTIPYWDERCGESFTNINDFELTFNKFINNLSNYKPREYILENLSIEVCNKRFIEVANKI
jgi:hypothetical protein